MNKTYFKYLILAFGLMFITDMAFGQGELLAEVDQRRIQLNKINMSVLGTWAVGNIVGSGILRSQTQGSTRYFHEMNVIWNIVNLGLAAGGLYGAFTEDPSSYSLEQTYAAQQQIEKILLFNLALNGTYITAGALMRERSKNILDDDVKRDRFKGYGTSLMVQGGFLLLFDLTQFILHHQHATPKLREVLEGIEVNGNGIGMVIYF